MKYTDHNTVEELKIAYVGGGSQGWAWHLMSDLAVADDISGEIALYDINYKAAKTNEIIGNRYKDLPDCASKWNYYATETLEEALTGADFVVISILPGTFDEMAVDVHTPEKYGIYQSVGDTTGPGGLMRTLRTVPQIEVIARGIEKCCPNAWVINYTNPMTQCIKALYNTFPGIRAFGCCHEVFGTQKLLVSALADMRGIKDVHRSEIKINVVGINHFTWINKATWRGEDLLPIYREFAEKYKDTGFNGKAEINWMNSASANSSRVKFDLFLRYGAIAAAGDRHLAEFCPKSWYLTSEKQANSWGFGLTTVDWRKKRQSDLLEEGRKKASGEQPVVIRRSEEEGVMQMRALLGLCDFVTNVNIPNMGQIPNLPMGTIVETNAAFRDGQLTPVFAGPIPAEIDAMVRRIASAQLMLAEAAKERDLEKAFAVFVNDPLVDLPVSEARKLFDEMVEGTKEYLQEYLK
ncbi:MAG: alpha-glucosidase/alpha-galactosidase [Oscillospiraceae bacterium]|nr:alpha-glucosidase/alpha-galactosidase [Oscillospiraceae bacterium]